MALPTSGPLSIDDIHIEAGGASGSLAGLNNEDIRDLIGKASGETSTISEFYGAASASGNVEIRAWGGWGGDVYDEVDGGRGKGRRLTWIGTVISGTRINLMAGGNGTSGQAYQATWEPYGSGGGGASTAYLGSNQFDHTYPLLIAGGGGGSGVSLTTSSGSFNSAGGFANANGPGAGESPITTGAPSGYVAPQGGNLNGSGSGGAGGSVNLPNLGVTTGGAGTAWSNGTGGIGGNGFLYNNTDGASNYLSSLGGRSIYLVSGTGGRGTGQLLGLGVYDMGSSGGGGGYGGGGGAAPNGTGSSSAGGAMLGGAAGGSGLFSQPSLGATYASTSNNGSLSANSGGRIELWVDGVKVKERWAGGNSSSDTYYIIP
jgi:hypothetical protein